MSLTLLVVEDDSAIALALKDYLESEGYSVLCATHGESALELLRQYQPHLLLVDIALPTMDGYELVRQIRLLPDFRLLPVMFLTARSQVSDRIRGYQSGCDVYVSKPFSLAEVSAIVRNLLDRTQVMQHRALQVSMAEPTEPPQPVLSLTKREQQVLQWLCHGFSNRQIGQQLRLSPRTIEKYVSRLFHKTETSNRAELVRFALDHQLMDGLQHPQT